MIHVAIKIFAIADIRKPQGINARYVGVSGPTKNMRTKTTPMKKKARMPTYTCG